MRKLKLQVQVSIDGFIAGPGNEMDWMVWDWDEALMDYVKNLTAPVDLIVLGRVLAQGFIPHWAAAATAADQDAVTLSFSKKMHETAKVVFTKTIDVNEWPHTALAKGDLVEEIAQLKKQDGEDIIVYGGGTFVSNLIKHNLIDEYHLFVNPTVLGSGMPIFQGLESRASMKLVRAQPFSCGIVVLHYNPA